MYKLYSYSKCSTCRKAIKWLDTKSIKYTLIDITEKPPTNTELKKMLKHYSGELKKLFNTSGVQYRELDIKNKITQMTTNEAIQLLSHNGKLVKRPFIINSSKGAVGFKEDQWLATFK